MISRIESSKGGKYPVAEDSTPREPTISLIEIMLSDNLSSPLAQ